MTQQSEGKTKILLIWNYICSIFMKTNFKMKKIVYKIFGEPISNEKGIKGTSSGKLYIDKKVFFVRPEVKEAIKRMKDSENIQSQLEFANTK